MGKAAARRKIDVDRKLALPGIEVDRLHEPGCGDTSAAANSVCHCCPPRWPSDQSPPWRTPRQPPASACGFVGGSGGREVLSAGCRPQIHRLNNSTKHPNE